MITLPKQFKSINSVLAMLGIELTIDGETVDVCNAIGDTVLTKELQDWPIVFAPYYNNVCTLPERKFPFKNAQAEFLWYMSGDARSSAISNFIPNWSKFANDYGTVNSNYGVYWHKFIPMIINELKTDKHSRRAVLNIYNANEAPFGKDTPCTLTLQFLIRKKRGTDDEQLNMICNMRSNDIWFGLSIDQFCNSLLHQLVYHSLLDTYPNLNLGWYAHHAGSMHVYVSDSLGNSTITTKTLVDMYSGYTSSMDEGKRFELPRQVTFENFWQSTDILPFESERLQHFIAVRSNLE